MADASSSIKLKEVSQSIVLFIIKHVLYSFFSVKCKRNALSSSRSEVARKLR